MGHEVPTLKSTDALVLQSQCTQYGSAQSRQFGAHVGQVVLRGGCITGKKLRLRIVDSGHRGCTGVCGWGHHLACSCRPAWAARPGGFCCAREGASRLLRGSSDEVCEIFAFEDLPGESHGVNGRYLFVAGRVCPFPIGSSRLKLGAVVAKWLQILYPLLTHRCFSTPFAELLSFPGLYPDFGVVYFILGDGS